MRILITGGAGFIGCNLAEACIRAGHQVTIFDNLSRRGSQANLAWLRVSFGDGFRFIQGDIRDYPAILAAAAGQEAIYHLAAQTAVTTSVTDPRPDFEINALGTFNVLEAARHAGYDPVFIYSSTNKVYGGMEDAPATELATRYVLEAYPDGVSEERPLDFHRPYGCSKGAADQYVHDYARIYGLRSVVFRRVVHLWPTSNGGGGSRLGGVVRHRGGPLASRSRSTATASRCAICCTSTTWSGRFSMATERIDVTKGQVYNLGGGPANTLSIWAEFGPLLSELTGRAIVPAAWRDWRPGDQPVFVADVSKARREFGWAPQVSVRDGIARLVAWVKS